MLLTGIRGDKGQGYPLPPFGARHTKGYPRANFLFFFSTHPITSPIYPFSLLLRGFLFLCVYFPIRVSFRVSEGKNGENKNCFSYPTCVYAVIIRPILILCYFSLLYLPFVCFFSLCYVLLLWMLCFSLICPFFYHLWGFLCFYV